MISRSQAPIRLAVLVSGNGSNLQAILDACASGLLKAEIVVVVSNRAEAFALERAKKSGLSIIIKERQPGIDRQKYDQELADEIATFSPDWVILAGWMRLLSAEFLNVFPNRVMNIHPALPGTFPGTHAIEQAYAAYQRGEIHQTGVMVHLVPDEGVDCGPVLGQTAVPIASDDTLETLESRIHIIEHQLIVKTLADMINQPA
jgi:phosphoribosylglycinamide formyltransferase 1